MCQQCDHEAGLIALRRGLGLGDTGPVGMGERILVEGLVDGADVAAPVEVGSGVGKVNHRDGGCYLGFWISMRTRRRERKSIEYVAKHPFE